jgi:transposase InsO family protein
VTAEFNLLRSLRGHQPIFSTAQHLYLFRRGNLYRTSHALETPVLLARIPADRPLISRGPRLLERMFRTSIQSAAQCDANTLLLARRSRIWRVNLGTGEVVLDHALPDGRSLLALSTVTSAATGTDWLVFGEYLNNPGRTEVRLWRRKCSSEAQWEVAATFPAGEIDHVHSIQQLHDGRIFILTGDFDKAAGVWETDAEFNKLRPVMRGRQQYRACWWFESGGSIVYGTDSQFETNALLLLQPDKGITKIHDLPGSCIYNGLTGNSMAFSTTVEPGASTGILVRDIFSRSVGPGITGDPTIYYYTGELSKVFTSPKDVWPSRLGQFGTFMFPSGKAPENRIYAYGVAVKKYDGDCLVFEKR